MTKWAPSPPRWVAAHLAVAVHEHIRRRRSAERVDGGQYPWELEIFEGLFAAWGRDDTQRVAAASPPPTPRRLLNTSEAADALAVSESKAKQLIRDGLLPSVLIGGCRRVHVDDLDAYIEGQRGSMSGHAGSIGDASDDDGHDAPHITRGPR